MFYNVIPAKAGIQNLLKLLDPRFRGDDVHLIFQRFLKGIDLFTNDDM